MGSFLFRDSQEGPLSPYVIATLLTTLLLFIPIYFALHRPIPGVPYNKSSLRRLTGDAPLLRAAPRMRTWLRDQCLKHNSPIVQVFPAPFSKPWVLVADHREAFDIMMRRTHEFDRSRLTIESFGGVLGNSHICMRSGDSRFKENRALLRDLMTVGFLNEVGAPELYEKMTSVLDLWSLKTEIGNGRAFRADQDIYKLALDITTAVVFDLRQRDTMLVKQIANLRSLKESPGSVNSNSDDPYPFSNIPLDPELEACVYLSDSIGLSFQSPFPKLSNWWYLRRTKSKKMLELKNGLIRRNIDAAIQRLESTHHPARKRRAVDQILLREKEAAEHENRGPNYHKQTIYDELFGLLVMGHDTTSTAIQWFVKYIALSQPTQSRLRSALHTMHPSASAQKRLPTVQEITGTYIPYLEAVISETLRFAHIVPIILREAIVDTHIFNYFIPKGTQIWFLSNGPSYLSPSLPNPIPQESPHHTDASNHRPVHFGTWEPSDIHEFKPERWLKTASTPYETLDQDKEKEVFVQTASPSLPFGAGTRGCFGRRLAWLELRIVVSLMVWGFEFLEVKEELAGLEVVDRATEGPKDCFVRVRRMSR